MRISKSEDGLPMPIYNEFSHIVIDDARIDETCRVYFKWKD